MPDSQHSSPENPPIPTDFGAPSPASPHSESRPESSGVASAPIETQLPANANSDTGANTKANTNQRSHIRPIPSSPMERARLESQGHLPPRNPAEERSTMVAFGLLFVLPLVIILFAALLLLPYINSQLNQDPDPGGATTQTSPNQHQLPPTR